MDQSDIDYLQGQLLALTALSSALLHSMPQAQRPEFKTSLEASIAVAREKRVVPEHNAATLETFDQACAAFSTLI